MGMSHAVQAKLLVNGRKQQEITIRHLCILTNETKVDYYDLKKLPYFSLYVQDFLTDEKLMECSALATGICIKTICD